MLKKRIRRPLRIFTKADVPYIIYKSKKYNIKSTEIKDIIKFINKLQKKTTKKIETDKNKKKDIKTYINKKIELTGGPTSTSGPTSSSNQSTQNIEKDTFKINELNKKIEKKKQEIKAITQDVKKNDQIINNIKAIEEEKIDELIKYDKTDNKYKLVTNNLIIEGNSINDIKKKIDKELKKITNEKEDLEDNKLLLENEVFKNEFIKKNINKSLNSILNVIKDDDLIKQINDRYNIKMNTNTNINDFNNLFSNNESKIDLLDFIYDHLNDYENDVDNLLKKYDKPDLKSIDYNSENNNINIASILKRDIEKPKKIKTNVQVSENIITSPIKEKKNINESPIKEKKYDKNSYVFNFRNKPLNDVFYVIQKDSIYDNINNLFKKDNIKIDSNTSYDDFIKLFPENSLDRSILLNYMYDYISNWIIESEQGNGKSIYNFGLWNYQIDKIMEPFKLYIKTITLDELDDMIKYIYDNKILIGSFILNTGNHWTAIYYDFEKEFVLEYYDPFGEPPKSIIIKLFKDLILKFNIEVFVKFKINRVQQQNIKTSNCGWFSMYFLIMRFNNYTFKYITKFKSIKQEELNIEQLKDKYDKFGFL